jgi:ribosomal protein L37AE/L43A
VEFPSKTSEETEKRTFRVPVSTGVFEHSPVLRDALWLLLYYVDKTTQEVEGNDGLRLGKVLGGKPCRDEDAASTLRRSRRTIIRWRVKLANAGYIIQKRTPIGYQVTVCRSKKWVTAALRIGSSTDGRNWPPDSRVKCKVVTSEVKGCHIRSDKSSLPYRQNSTLTVTKSVEQASEAFSHENRKAVQPGDGRWYVDGKCPECGADKPRRIDPDGIAVCGPCGMFYRVTHAPSSEPETATAATAELGERGAHGQIGQGG